MRIVVSANGGVPTDQIRDQIRGLIATGALGAGERLPSVRQLAQDLDVAPRTVAKAYKVLEAEGVLQTRVGAGTRVAESASLTPVRVLEAARSLSSVAQHHGLSAEDAQRILRAVW